jgi:hypothetical protein
LAVANHAQANIVNAIANYALDGLAHRSQNLTHHSHPSRVPYLTGFVFACEIESEEQLEGERA